jgi:hypothetical protein
MKNIILDHFRRWWWVWLISVIAYGALVLGISTADNKFCGICPFGIWMGALLLCFDMQRGHTRSIVTMPVTAKQVARAWWWVAIGLPTVVITVVTALIFTGFSGRRHDWSGLSVCAILCVSNFLTLATMFYALTGLPRAGAGYSDWGSHIRGVCFGGLWGISFAGWLVFQNMNLTLIAGLGLLLAAVCLTIMGWFRAELLVRDRAGSLATSLGPCGKSAMSSRSTEGYGGLVFLAQNIFSRMAYMGVAMFAVFTVVLPLINISLFHSASTDYMGDSFPIFSFQFLWIMTFQVAVFTMNIRYLRTLPISTWKLAAVLVFTALAAMLLIFYGATSLLSAIFQAPLPGPGKIIQQGTLLQIAVATTAVPLFIWRPLEVRTFLIMILAMGGGMFAIFFKQNPPSNFSVAASVIIVLGVFLVTKRLLERSSRAYRPRTGQFGDWNWGGGR